MVQVITPEDLREQLSEQESPVVLVNFWASWCEPCKVEFPHILEVRERFGPKGLGVMLISIDDPSEIPAVEAFLREQKVDFPTYFKGEQPLNFVSQIYPEWSGAVPATVLFSKDGRILEAWEGDTSLNEFEARVKRHLGGT